VNLLSIQACSGFYQISAVPLLEYCTLPAILFWRKLATVKVAGH